MCECQRFDFTSGILSEREEDVEEVRVGGSLATGVWRPCLSSVGVRVSTETLEDPASVPEQHWCEAEGLHGEWRPCISSAGVGVSMETHGDPT